MNMNGESMNYFLQPPGQLLQSPQVPPVFIVFAARYMRNTTRAATRTVEMYCII